MAAARVSDSETVARQRAERHGLQIILGKVRPFASPRRERSTGLIISPRTEHTLRSRVVLGASLA